MFINAEMRSMYSRIETVDVRKDMRAGVVQRVVEVSEKPGAGRR